jgi:hypothetical protein
MFTRLADLPSGIDPHIMETNQTPFVGGWSEEDRRRVTKSLTKAWRGQCPRGNLLQAIASMVLSVGVEKIGRDLDTHISRDWSWYSSRYTGNTGDPLYTYRLVTGAADWLEAHGYLIQVLGHHHPNDRRKCRQTVLSPTTRLLAMVGPMIKRLGPRTVPRRETVIVRDVDDDGRIINLPYDNTPETDAIHADLDLFNDEFETRELHLHGNRVTLGLLMRIFHKGFDRGGRMYFEGDSYQNLPSEERVQITEVIGGVAHPFVEIDYPAHHIRIAYAYSGTPMPEGDAYSIPGFERRLVKLAGLVMFNASSEKSAIGALKKEANCSRKTAEAVITAFARKHPGIVSFFFSDAGAHFMRIDSDMAVEVMKRAKAKVISGKYPLPMHDSFLVPACDAEVLKDVMTQVADENQLSRGELKVTSSMSVKDQIISIMGRPTQCDEDGLARELDSSSKQPTTLPPTRYGRQTQALDQHVYSEPPASTIKDRINEIFQRGKAAQTPKNIIEAHKEVWRPQAEPAEWECDMRRSTQWPQEVKDAFTAALSELLAERHAERDAQKAQQYRPFWMDHPYVKKTPEEKAANKVAGQQKRAQTRDTKVRRATAYLAEWLAERGEISTREVLETFQCAGWHKGILGSVKKSLGLKTRQTGCECLLSLP